MMELLLQELFLTAFVVLVFSFLIGKLVLFAVSAADGDFVESGKKGIDETVKLDRGLKVGGAKSRKRVRFAGDEVVEKVEKFSGEEGLVCGMEEFCGNKGGDLGISLEEKRGEAIVEEGNMVYKELGRVIGSVRELGSDEIVGEQSEEVVRDLEELVVEERIESKGMEGNIVNAGLEENNENVEVDDEKRVGMVSDDVVGDQTREVRVLKDLVSEETIARSVKEYNVLNSALDELVVDRTIENEVAGIETSVKLASEGVVGDRSGEVRVLEVRGDQGNGIGEKLGKVNEKGEGLVSDEDDDWEGIERSEMEKVFATAASYVDSGGKDDRLLNLGSDVQMQLYGLHKVAMEGPCYEAQPMALKVSARAKWNAWQRLGNMNPEVAMEQYVNLLSDKDPGWMQGHSAVDGKPESSEVASSGVPETNASTFLDKQTNSMEMNLEPKFDKDGSDLTGSSNSIDADN